MEAGREVVGLDLSFDLLYHARDLPEGRQLLGRLVRADSRRLPFDGAAFDAVCLLFSSFGYFDDEENAGLLSEVARVLRPGGAAVLDIMNPERIRAGLVPESKSQRDGFVLHERRSLECFGRRVVKHVELIRDDGGPSERWHEDVRMYGTNELQLLAKNRGLELLRAEGDFDGSPFDSGPNGSPRQILWFRRIWRHGRAEATGYGLPPVGCSP